MTPQERVNRYNAHLPANCDHPAKLEDWPAALQEPYSHDPYAHTKHACEISLYAPSVERVRAKVKQKLKQEDIPF